MSVNLIGSDIKLMRDRYDEALTMRGVPAIYQFPNMATSNNQGEPLIDSYSEEVKTHVFFDGNPKIRTFKRLGWVVENDKDLPFLVHCSFHLPNVQRDSIFRIAGQYSELPERTFRVTHISYDMQAPDHIVCQVVPVYEDQTVGKTDKEISKQFNRSNYFMKPNSDYRGDYHTTEDELE